MVWVAAVGGAALGCYMLSLQVATERADLAKVERRIISAKQQIRSLQTELGTRGRLSQLEQWNQDVLALSAPATGQFLQNEVLLARFDVNQPTIADNAEVRMASMETHDTGPAAAAPTEAGPKLAVEEKAPATVQPAIVHRAGYVTSAPEAASPPTAAARKPAMTAQAPAPRPAAASARPARLGVELADELGAAARGEKAAAPVAARPDRSRAALKGGEASRDPAPARVFSPRPVASPAKAGSAKPGESRTAARGPATPASRSGAGSGGNR
jgi:hypothetical protein